jgi:glycosyltransferase involved in cell wall biosynthesis
VNAPSHSGVNVLAGYWVVIPAFNEAATIKDVASRALRQNKNVIVVDDGSTDGTAEALLGLPVSVLRNQTNRGKAASLWRGFQQALAAGASGVVTLDGDGQHAPEDIPRLLAVAAFYPDHVIIGARHRDQRRAAFWRYVANRVADFWISWAAGYSFEDSQSGFRIYPSSLLSLVEINHGKARSFVFESEILIEVTRLGYRSVAVPIEALRLPGARPSYFRPVLDIARITCMVGWKLISRGMYPIGLYCSLFGQTSCLSSEYHAVEEIAPARFAQPAPLEENGEAETAITHFSSVPSPRHSHM